MEEALAAFEPVFEKCKKHDPLQPFDELTREVFFVIERHGFKHESIFPRMLDFAVKTYNLYRREDTAHLLETVFAISMIHVYRDHEVWAKWVHYRCIRNNYTHVPPLTDPSLPYISKLQLTNPAVKALFDMRFLIVALEEDHIAAREKFQKALLSMTHTFDQWIGDPILNPIDSLPLFSANVGFNLTYHNLNNSFLLYMLANLYQKILKFKFKDAYMEPNFNQFPRKRKKRIGFISRFMHCHSVGKYCAGIINGVHKSDKYEVYVFASNTYLQIENDPVRKIIEDGCTKFHLFDGLNILGVVEMLLSAQLDAIVFVDPIMDIILYLISMYRVAPVQFSTWGHPDTTGNPNIDYFVSSQWMESGNDNYYIEKLISLPSINMHYYRLNVTMGRDVVSKIKKMTLKETRELVGFPVDAHLYGFMASPSKFSRETAFIIKEILRRDPKGQVVMIRDWNTPLFDAMLGMMANILGEKTFERIIIIPYQGDTEKYLHVAYCQDVIMDSFPFGGLISTMEQLELSVPMVCMTGQKLYNRFTSGLYRKMGITDLIASNIEDYIEKAIFVASHPDVRSDISKRISDNYHVLIEDQETIQDWVRVFDTHV